VASVIVSGQFENDPFDQRTLFHFDLESIGVFVNRKGARLLSEKGRVLDSWAEL
jgi:hypothetical protein